MTAEEIFLEKFQLIFEDTPKDDIRFSTVFKDLIYWDSISILSLIVLFEEKYKIIISIKDINNATTVEDLFKLISVNAAK